jgi:Polyketide cyclase / dehydrase and lipid transport
MTLRLTGVVIGSLAVTSWLCAATVGTVGVSRKQERYALFADAHLEATPDSIYDVLTDYDDDRFGRIWSAYKESRYLDPALDGTPIVYTRMEGCVLRYCMSLRRTERLETEQPYRIKTYTVPEQSNFKFSTSEWVLEPDGAGGTKVTYRLEMEPDFRVPPLIGPWYLKRTLSQGVARALVRIEGLARELDGQPLSAAIPVDRAPREQP